MALLRLEPGLLIWLWIAFGIVVLILRLTVWDKIVAALDARSTRIATDLETARKAAEDAKVSLEATQAALDEGKKKAAVIIEQARYQASLLKEQLIKDTRAEIVAERARATKEIEQAREQALSAIRQEIVKLSLEIAQAVLKREVSEKDNRALLDQMLEKFPAAN